LNKKLAVMMRTRERCVRLASALARVGGGRLIRWLSKKISNFSSFEVILIQRRVSKDIGKGDDANQTEMGEVGKCSGKGGWRQADQVVVKEDLQLLQF